MKAFCLLVLTLFLVGCAPIVTKSPVSPVKESSYFWTFNHKCSVFRVKDSYYESKPYYDTCIIMSNRPKMKSLHKKYSEKYGF